MNDLKPSEPPEPPEGFDGRLARVLEGSHLPGLDGLRALAVILVMMLHTRLFAGHGGVIVFYVLSGFLITWVLLREEARWGAISVRTFWIRRALRIFPVFYVFWLVHLAFVDTTFQWVPEGQRWSAFIYLSDYYQAITGEDRGAMTHTWSLGIEEKFYFLWPLCFRALRTAGRRALALGILIGVVQVVRAWITLGLDDPQYAYYAFETRMDQLAIGCLIAVTLRARMGIGLWRLLCGGPWRSLVPLLAIFGVAVACMSRDHSLRVLYSFPVQAAASGWLVVHMILWSGRGPLAWLSTRPLQALGRISYSVYLWQMVGIELVTTLWPTASSGVAMLLAWPTVIAIATLSYVAIERPCLHYKRRFQRVAATEDSRPRDAL
jgi:peptidoglycan/LPS O-acetylase OafA/YrhL